MKKAFSLLLVIALSATSSTALAKDGQDKVADKDRADAVFQQALAADQAGDAKQRDQLLAETLQINPNHKLARWHSGQVLFNGQWKTVDAISRHVSKDPRWQEYRERVEASVDSLASHADVARWCRAQKLELEEQWHWFNVLRHDASNREALGRLGLRPYKGDLLTTEQIAEYEASEEQAEADFKRYAKLLKLAMREAERTEGAERSAALKQISSISDPAAIQAIVEFVLADAKNEKRVLSKLGEAKGGKLIRQMQVAAITALSGIPEHTATLRLMEVGLYASNARVRTEAAKALRYREPTSFMPMLMAGLAAPIELSFTVNTLPNGQITVFEDFTEAGPLASKKHTRSNTYLTQHVSTHTQDTTLRADRFTYGKTYRSSGIARVWSEQWRDMANATAQVTNTKDRVDLENAMRKERNTRIQHVLGLASGKELGEDPEEWWSDWKSYNELYTPEELPVNETEESYDYSRRYEQYTYARSLPTLEQRPRTRSCFVAGTPVWTQAGPVAIETLKIGDLVLSQDPRTGQLDYRPVTDTTVRPASPTVELSVGKETIVATRGHRFWITGQGWQMAKFLKAGDQLFTVTGSTDLQNVKDGPEFEAYNLEVGQFHTYFVGETRLLALDNSCPLPTTNILPGVSPGGQIAPQLAAKN
jgi:hypothetical protein